MLHCSTYQLLDRHRCFTAFGKSHSQLILVSVTVTQPSGASPEALSLYRCRNTGQSANDW